MVMTLSMKKLSSGRKRGVSLEEKWNVVSAWKPGQFFSKKVKEKVLAKA